MKTRKFWWGTFCRVFDQCFLNLWEQQKDSSRDCQSQEKHRVTKTKCSVTPWVGSWCRKSCYVKPILNELVILSVPLWLSNYKSSPCKSKMSVKLESENFCNIIHFNLLHNKVFNERNFVEVKVYRMQIVCVIKSSACLGILDGMREK